MQKVVMEPQETGSAGPPLAICRAGSSGETLKDLIRKQYDQTLTLQSGGGRQDGREEPETEGLEMRKNRRHCDSRDGGGGSEVAGVGGDKATVKTLQRLPGLSPGWQSGRRHPPAGGQAAGPSLILLPVNRNS